MEGSSCSSCNLPEALAKPASELEALKKQHEKKTQKIQELKRRIEAAKLRLEMKKKKENNDTVDEKKQAFKNLSEEHNSLREEYNALLGKGQGIISRTEQYLLHFHLASFKSGICCLTDPDIICI